MSFRDYLLHGWKLCAIRPGFKGPTGEAAKGWQTREKAIGDPALGGAMVGAGLLHAWSGTCALDIDNMAVAEKWLAERGIDLTELRTARNSVHISSGREGRDKLLYLLPTPLRSVKLAPYKKWSEKSQKEETYHAFELRCANSAGESVQDVLPPSVHPQTARPYTWAYGDDTLGDWRFTPEIVPRLLELWTAEVQTAPVAAIA
jgi:putative DNA primase/helicase